MKNIILGIVLSVALSTHSLQAQTIDYTSQETMADSIATQMIDRRMTELHRIYAMAGIMELLLQSSYDESALIGTTMGQRAAMISELLEHSHVILSGYHLDQIIVAGIQSEFLILFEEK